MILSIPDKSYPFTKQGLTKAIIENKTDRFGRVTQVLIYLIIAGLLINKTLDMKFLTTYVAAMTGSKVAKVLSKAGKKK